MRKQTGIHFHINIFNYDDCKTIEKFSNVLQWNMMLERTRFCFYQTQRNS